MTKICIIAGSYQEALTWAKGQQLCHDCWFYPTDIEDLNQKTNFHVIVIGTAGLNVPSAFFERVYNIAQRQGQIGRE